MTVMKRRLLAGLAVVAVLLTGCSAFEPTKDPRGIGDNKAGFEYVEDETVHIIRFTDRYVNVAYRCVNGDMIYVPSGGSSGFHDVTIVPQHPECAS